MDSQETAGRLAAERAGALQRLAGLERELAGIIDAAAAANADDEHDPEGATIAFERQHTAALLDQAREHLARIDAAARRLADGSYGTCTGCGGPIGAARLAARPVATTCIGCAARQAPGPPPGLGPGRNGGSGTGSGPPSFPGPAAPA